MLATLRHTLGLGLLSLGWSAQPTCAQVATVPPGLQAPVTPAIGVSYRANLASFGQEGASAEVHHLVNWVAQTRDNQGLPFLVVDKARALVLVFYADGRLRGVTPALLGLAIGDDSVPGIGDRKLASILPHERTTPAGRFVANLDRNLGGKEILWVDYDSAISLHPVVTSNTRERRAERLASQSPQDNRISYGCINVPAEFFKQVVSAAFKQSNGIVYVLPETRSLHKVFAFVDVAVQK